MGHAAGIASSEADEYTMNDRPEPKLPLAGSVEAV